LLTLVGRMCREGQQAKCVHAIIIADRSFRGDQAAFDIKDERAKEDWDMSRPFHRDDYAVFDKISDRYHLPLKELGELEYQERLAIVNKRIAADRLQKRQEVQKRQAPVSRPKSVLGGSGLMPVEIS
jgi:hypothetical protein